MNLNKNVHKIPRCVKKKNRTYGMPTAGFISINPILSNYGIYKHVRQMTPYILNKTFLAKSTQCISMKVYKRLCLFTLDF